MHPILIKNADVYAPEHLGTRDIFLAGGKIVAMAEKLDVTLPDLEVIDAAGYIVAPGLVDQHIHITGGGGEGGWHSRCPELVFSELVKAGVTTFLGVSGTDSMTRSVENLLAKVRGLKNEAPRAGCGRATTPIRSPRSRRTCAPTCSRFRKCSA